MCAAYVIHSTDALCVRTPCVRTPGVRTLLRLVKCARPGPCVSCVQAVLTLAVAETCIEFEHRDLHWGNLLLRPLPSKAAPISFALRGQSLHVTPCGVQLSMIDFSFSRMRIGACGEILHVALDELPPMNDSGEDDTPWLFAGEQKHPQVRSSSTHLHGPNVSVRLYSSAHDATAAAKAAT